MWKKVVRVTIAMALTAGGTAHAGIDKAGTTAANFLTVGSGAGVLGMSGAVLGLGRDLNAAAWNPSALGWVNETQFVLSHSGLADEQAQEWMGAGGRLGATGTRWALTGLYHGQGSFEGRDASGASTGSFNVSSTALGVNLAQNFGGRGTVGLGMKYVSEDLGTTRGSGVTFDLGAMLQAGRFGFGVAAQNLSGSMKYDGASYPFPTSYGMGASVSLPEQGLRVAVDANFPEAYYSDVRGGIEWMWRDQFALRAGYRSEMGAASGEPLSGPSFGMGAGLGGLWFDYGYVISGPGAGGEHRVGMTLRPGGFTGAFGHAGPDQADVESSRKASDSGAAAAARAEADRKRAAAIEAEKAEATRRQAAKFEAAKAEAARQEAAQAETAKQQEAAQAEAAKQEAAKAEAAKAAAIKAAADKAAAKKAADAAPKKIPTSHKVAAGETLYRIAKMYGTTVPKIMELNNMVNETIRVGEVLKLPQPERR